MSSNSVLVDFESACSGRRVRALHRDTEEFAQLREQYLRHFAPAGPAERHEVETLCCSEWRIERLRHQATGQDAIASTAALYRLESSLQRDYDRALRRILDLQGRRHSESPRPKMSIVPRQHLAA